MGAIYVYSDKWPLAAELISFGKKIGESVVAITFNRNAADALSQYGPDKVYLVEGSSGVDENYSRSVAELLKNEGADLFLAGATARGRELAARVAGYLECGMVSDAISIARLDGRLHFERLLYGGTVVQEEVIEGIAVATVSPGKYEAVQGTTEAEIVTLALEADSRVSLIKRMPITRKGADLASADKIVCIGMGMEKREDMAIAEELAQVLGAEIGGTRGIAETRQWLQEYIGISGITVRPSLYLSMGVSGQVQHVVGIRDSKVIVAIDINEKAPIFKVADYGIVGDMYEIVPLLAAEIKMSKEQEK